MRNKLRLATWIVCLLAIMVSFACVITAANNIVENNAKVIFISGTGDGYGGSSRAVGAQTAAYPLSRLYDTCKRPPSF